MNVTISYHDAVCCAVAFAYDVATKDTVKALPGATYDDGAWIVPILHLPILKLIFDSMTVAPEVVTAYQALLKRMLCDALADDGNLLAATLFRHANGIAHVTATGWQPTRQPRRQYVAQPVTVTTVEPAVIAPDLALWLRSVQGAVKADERKENIKRNVRRKKATA